MKHATSNQICTVPMEKNHEISVLKFIFAFFVLLGHTWMIAERPSWWPYVANIAPFAVEFFFIVSGYLMVSSWYRHDISSDACNGEKTARFITRKISGISLQYVIAFLFAFALNIIVPLFKNKPDNIYTYIFEHIIRSIPEALCMIGTGLNTREVLGDVWYISAMLIALMVLYYLLCRYKKTFLYVIAPVVALLVLGYRYRVLDGYGDSNMTFSGILCIGMIRAIGGLCLGSVAYTLSEKLRSYDFSLFGRIFITFSEVFGWLILLVGLFCFKYSAGIHFPLFIILVLLIAIVMSNQSYICKLFKSKHWDKLGAASLWVYLVHFKLARLISDHLYDNGYKKNLLILIVATTVMCLIEYGIYLLIKKNMNTIKKLFIKNKETESIS